ncbi:MAG: hypothetical protein A3C90_00665 [Candidatus Magasanikbacteria bacterium RIFCSPHIGHO2_02_FULL_51_14]|uniref:Hydrolase TatD n=1 Tax=Candidatus Magasanikbacteria bacterium RIFCSPHIGHO2_02_FULL_51_14 TaxID=1798683 RepID=A0A1F6MF88_9BACT|nr:MAG: hypothetical protein A3C90_00665 [Candidatus Magasanikbacteria bacterium RIFCSPHIGHO2_02_FULL_51_14]
MLFDSHCHLQFRAYDEDRGEVIRRCQEKGVVLNIVGTQSDTSRMAVELAEQYDNMYATIGLHPIQEHVVAVEEEGSSFTSRGEAFDTALYDELAQSKKVIAIGETGLDRFHVPADQPWAEVVEKQWAVFQQHAVLAQKNDLPLVIHVRDAHEEMIGRLEDQKIERSRDQGSGMRAVVHCYTSNWMHAQQYLDLGFYLGLTGVITFPPKKTDPQSQLDLLEVVKKMPLDRMLVETDAPFLAPQAYRGDRCEPWMVEEVVKKIAEVRGLSAEEVEKATTENARRLFAKMMSS